MRILVVHGSRSGATQAIAQHMGDALTHDGHDVVVADAADEPTPDGFDLVIVGGGVRASKLSGKTTAWLEARVPELRDIPFALFWVSLSGAAPAETVPASSGLRAVDEKGFKGWYFANRVNWFERQIMKQMKTDEGDYRDPHAEASWARAVVDRVQN